MQRTSRLLELVPGVWVATSRWYATTSTALLDGEGGAIVVDPAFLADELAAIPRDLQAIGVRCIGGLATHEHYDHVLWHPDLGDVPRWSSGTTAARVEADHVAALAPLQEHLTPDLIAIAGRLAPLPDGSLPWAGPEAQCIEHNAHAPGHIAVFLPESGVLVAGDMLSDVELPMPTGDETLATYLEGLERLLGAVRAARWVVPGHGTPGSGPMAWLDADRRYLDDIIAGRPSDDPRIDAENADTHAANLERARAQR
jgi:glyoxylase-like metal-dependent hydrolase (beta-lactamase superfamily II)